MKVPADRPETMPALVYTGPHAMTWTTVPLPQPRPGEALVRVAAVGICGSDMHAWHGHDGRRPPPLILGHEATGTVVGGVADGQRVAINPLVIEPDCPVARAGRPHLSPGRQIISMPPRQGAFAGFVTIPERNLLPVPETLTPAQAALTEPIAVAWHAVRIGRERLGAAESPSVLVLGGGAIGLCAALVARHMGAVAPVVVETNPARRALITARTGLVAVAPGDVQGIGQGSDLVIDAVGATATRAAASALVRPGGTIVHVGLLPGNDGLDLRRITLQEITLTGSYCYTPQDFADTLAAMAGGGLGALDWIETRPLAGGPAAFADLDAGRVSAPKVVLLP